MEQVEVRSETQDPPTLQVELIRGAEDIVVSLIYLPDSKVNTILGTKAHIMSCHFAKNMFRIAMKK